MGLLLFVQVVIIRETGWLSWAPDLISSDHTVKGGALFIIADRKTNYISPQSQPESSKYFLSWQNIIVPT